PPPVLPFAPAPISVGVRVQVERSVFVRAGPSVFQPAITTEPSGALGTVIGGPVSADSRTWWQVQYDDGFTGWSEGDFLTVVVPVSPPGPQAPPIGATLGSGSQQAPSGTTSEPINTATGNYLFQRTDLAIPAPGLPLVLTRTYNSLDSYSGPLGP